MAHEEPAYLPVGTEVSAKYRGAFCEAKIKKLVRLVKCKVTVKEGNALLVVTDEDIKGTVKHGATVEVRLPDTTTFAEAIITKVTDCSTYTVVFDDGDENTLRRSQMCPKGEKHFVQSETLDQLPLTHPEHFGTPVMKPNKRRRKLTTGSESESDEESSDEAPLKRREYRGRLQELIGRVVCLEVEERKRSAWVPVLVCDPNASDLDLKTKEHLLLRSFKDSKFYAVSKKETKDFTRDMAVKNEDKSLKNAFEKALAFFDSKELPSNWVRMEMLGSDSEVDAEESSDDEPSEEKDLFVAQLFKFMDDRGTPINKAPSLGGRDLNLYRLFKVVQNLGGYNRVTNQVKWRQVYSRMGLPTTTTAANQIKAGYKKYLHAFEDFYRKLGSSMGTTSRPVRSRNNSGRSLFSLRERESPRSPRSEKKAKDEEKDKEKEKEKEKAKETEAPEPGPSEPDTKSVEAVDTESPRKSRARQAEEKKAEADVKPEKRVTREDIAKLEASKASKEEEKRKLEETTKTADAKRTEPPKAATESKRNEASKAAETKKAETPKAAESKKVEEEVKKEVTRTPREAPKKGKEAKKPESEKKGKDDSPLAGKKRPAPKKKATKVEEDKKEETSVKVVEEQEGSTEEDAPYEKKTRRQPGFAIGTKLKVKYGRGKEQKLYEAKIVEAEPEGGTTHYLVHYAGWNNRYDEWIMKERIVDVVECPDKPIKPLSQVMASKASKFLVQKKRALKFGTPTGGKPLAVSKSPAAAAAVKAPSKSPSPQVAVKTVSPAGRSPLTSVAKTPGTGSRVSAKKAASGTSTPPGRTRLTRQTSLDQVPSPARRRSRRNSGVADLDTESQEASDTEDAAGTPKMECPPVPEDPGPPPEMDLGPPASLVDTLVPEKELASSSSSSSGELGSADPTDVDEMIPGMRGDGLDYIQELMATGQGLSLAKDAEALTPEPPDFMAAMNEILNASKDHSGLQEYPGLLQVEKDPPSGTESPSSTGSGRSRGRRSKEPLKGKRRSEIIFADSMDSASSSQEDDQGEGIKPVDTPEGNEQLPTEPPAAEPVSIEMLDAPVKKEEVKMEEEVSEPVKVEPSPELPELAAVEPKEEDSEESVEGDMERKRLKKGKKKSDIKVEEEVVAECQEPPVLEAQVPVDTADPPPAPSQPEDEVPEPGPSQQPPVLKEDPGAEEPMEEVAPSQPEPPASTNEGPVAVEEPEVLPQPLPVQEPPAPPPTLAMREQEPEQMQAAHSLLSVMSAPPLAAPPAVMGDTPPATPEHSPRHADTPQTSPYQQQAEDGDEEEEELLGQPPGPVGSESPGNCDMSTISNSSMGSSGNVPSCESSGETALKRKHESESHPSLAAKRRKRGVKRNSTSDKGKSTIKTTPTASDSDEGVSAEAAVASAMAAMSNAPAACCSATPSPSKRHTITSSAIPPPNRPAKYNFNLEAGRYLEGEARIEFILDKINEIRKLYMGLKAEVACIDRRRKRHRRKLKEGKRSATGSPMTT